MGWKLFDESKFPNTCIECGAPIPAGSPVYLTKDPEFSPKGRWACACLDCMEKGIRPKTAAAVAESIRDDIKLPMPGGEKMPTDVDAMMEYLSVIDGSGSIKDMLEEGIIPGLKTSDILSSLMHGDVAGASAAFRGFAGTGTPKKERGADQLPTMEWPVSDMDAADALAGKTIASAKKRGAGGPAPWTLKWIKENAEWGA